MFKYSKTQKAIQIKPNMYKKHENLYITPTIDPYRIRFTRHSAYLHKLKKKKLGTRHTNLIKTKKVSPLTNPFRTNIKETTI
jgi:hypothetical protein